MTREEALRKVKGYLTDCLPADCYGEVEEIIEALKQEPVLDKIEEEINSLSRGTCDYFVIDRIEEIIKEYKAESEE